MDDFFNNNNNEQNGVSPDFSDDIKPSQNSSDNVEKQDNNNTYSHQQPENSDINNTSFINPQNNSGNSPQYGNYSAQNRFGTTPNQPYGNYNPNYQNNGYQNQGYQNFNGQNYQGNNNGNKNPYSTFANQGYDNRSYYGNSGPVNQNYNNQPNSAPKKKKGNSTGKVVFAVLICICIIIASVAIGSSFTSGSNTNNPSKSTESNSSSSEKNSSGALPSVEKTPADASEYSGKGEMNMEQIYVAVKDINVGVIVYSNNQKAGEGSGIIVGEDENKTYTYVLTCAHVISGNYKAQIQLNDDTEIDAEIVGYDTKTDVGVLRVKKTGLKAATFGDSSTLAVGQPVYAIGNPGGTEFFGTLTDGSITAIDRPVTTTSSSAYDLPCIQHNAAINPGNSGGALVNKYGQVIGLNSSKIADTEYEGMGFSVPINTVLQIYKDIVKHGYVTNRPMLGISYYAVSTDYTYSAIAWKNNLPYGSIVIATISQSSDLAGKDVNVGDIITAVNGKKLDSTDILLEAIEKANVGDTLTLTICRLNNNGSINSTFNVKIKLVEDKGDNIVEEEPTTEQSFYNFGYGDGSEGFNPFGW